MARFSWAIALKTPTMKYAFRCSVCVHICVFCACSFFLTRVSLQITAGDNIRCKVLCKSEKLTAAELTDLSQLITDELSEAPRDAAFFSFLCALNRAQSRPIAAQSRPIAAQSRSIAAQSRPIAPNRTQSHPIAAQDTSQKQISRPPSSRPTTQQFRGTCTHLY